MSCSWLSFARQERLARVRSSPEHREGGEDSENRGAEVTRHDPGPPPGGSRCPHGPSSARPGGHPRLPPGEQITPSDRASSSSRVRHGVQQPSRRRGPSGIAPPERDGRLRCRGSWSSFQPTSNSCQAVRRLRSSRRSRPWRPAPSAGRPGRRTGLRRRSASVGPQA